MDAREDVRARSPADGLVSAPAGAPTPVVARILLLLAATALASGVIGGLLRAGALDAGLAGTAPLGAARSSAPSSASSARSR